MRTPAALAAVAIVLAVPSPGIADDDENEREESVTRVSCAGGSAELRLRAEDGDDELGDVIEVGLRVDVRRPVPVWRLVLLHERRLLYQGTRRSTRAGYALRYERTVPEWDGRQTVTARLSTEGARVCLLEATI